MKKVLIGSIAGTFIITIGLLVGINSAQQTKPLQEPIKSLQVTQEQKKVEDKVPETSPEAPQQVLKQETPSKPIEEVKTVTSPVRTLEDVTEEEVIAKTFTQECQDSSTYVMRASGERFIAMYRQSVRNKDRTVWVNDKGQMACVYQNTMRDLGLE